MLPLAILNGQPVVGCICADGTFKTNCPAMRETAETASADDCCGAGCCARQETQETSHTCCDAAARETNDASRSQEPTDKHVLASKSCCQPAVEAAVPPPLVSAVQMVDDHHLLAPATLPAATVVGINAVSTCRQVDDDTGRPPTDLVITLGHLLI
jgi:hypothetical protein